MKIYIVTKGEYSDYRIRGVFTDREKADKFLDSITTKYGDNTIEEWDANIPDSPKSYKYFFVKMSKSGDVKYVCTSYYFSSKEEISFRFSEELMFSYQFAKDEKHAVKIANERRTRLIAENKWGVDNEAFS